MGVVAHERNLVWRTRELVRADLVGEVQEARAFLAGEGLYFGPREEELVVRVRPLRPHHLAGPNEFAREQAPTTDGASAQLDRLMEARERTLSEVFRTGAALLGFPLRRLRVLHPPPK